jgi:hypothetical protein
MLPRIERTLHEMLARVKATQRAVDDVTRAAEADVRDLR